MKIRRQKVAELIELPIDSVGIIPPSRLASFVLATTFTHAHHFLDSFARGRHAETRS